MQDERRVPENLQELLDSGETGYVLKEAHFLQLKHGLMGFFPALVGDTKRIVISTDRSVVEEAWKKLPPRRSELVTANFYVNDSLNVAFPMLGTSRYDNERSKPLQLLEREEFERLAASGGAEAFRWAPGLISDDMTQEEFMRTIDAARASAAA